MKQEIDRYRRLLQEWGGDTQGGMQQPKPVGQPQVLRSGGVNTPPPASEAPRVKLGRPQPAPASDPERYPSGAILVLNDEELVVYRRGVAGQPVDMVYSLLSDGNVKIEAMNLSEYQVSELGCLSADALRTLQAQMTWNRALVAPHCADPADGERIPEPAVPQVRPQPQMRRTPSQALTPSPDDSRGGFRSNGSRPGGAESHFARSEGAASAPRSAIDEDGKIRLRRGQRIVLKFGNKSWEAVYWGRDQTGPVVAHSTHRQWQLMHLELNRFKDCIVPDEEPNMDLVDEIMNALSTKMNH